MVIALNSMSFSSEESLVLHQPLHTLFFLNFHLWTVQNLSLNGKTTLLIIFTYIKKMEFDK